MKAKAIVFTLLLTVTGMAFGAGGRSVDNVDVSNITPTKAEVTPISVQGPTDQFNVKIDGDEKVDSSSLKQSYDGKS